MKVIYVILFCFFLNEVLIAQFGLQIGGEKQSIGFPNFNPTRLVPEDFLSGNGGVFYWFRIKNYRIEFLPGINFNLAKPKYSYSNDNDELDFKELGIQVQLPILFYPFQLIDDCNCPTFSKQDGIFEKGFHIILVPGVQYNQRNIAGTKKDAYLPYAKAGIAMDIAVSKLSSITPQILYGYYFNDPYIQDLNREAQKEKVKISHSTITFGIRYMVRWDYKN